MLITDAHLKAIYAHARQSYPAECAGFLLGTFAGKERVFQVVRGKNLITARNDRYELDPPQFVDVAQQAEDAGREIIGFYHSHPDFPPIPSQTDVDIAWEEMLYLIVSVYNGHPLNTRIWRLTEEKPERFQEITLEIIDEGGL